MNVLIANPYALFGLHLAADLEISENHLLKGDKVIYLVCDGELKTCYVNPDHQLVVCWTCKSHRQETLRFVPYKPSVVVSYSDIITKYDKRKIRNIATKTFRNKEDIKKYYIDNYDIGYEALSTIISISRNSEIDINEQKRLLEMCLYSGAMGYYATLNAIEKYKIDMAYVFNGRLAPTRGIIRALEQKKVLYFTHDRAYDLERYSLFANTVPHDFEYLFQEINNHWEIETDFKKKQMLAERFYEEKRYGKEVFSYVKGQEKGKMPNNWNENRKNIGIFLTSEDEFEAINDHTHLAIYENQLDAIKKIVTSLKAISHNLHLYLRLHPNMSRFQSDKFAHIESEVEFVTVINPESNIDTYELLQRCAAILTFGSTVGIEAVYYGVPSILVPGKAMYEKLGGTYQPTNHQDLVRLLLSDLEPMEKTPSYKYGYFMKTYGVPYRHFIPENYLSGKFYGHKIQPSKVIELICKAYAKVIRMVKKL